MAQYLTGGGRCLAEEQIGMIRHAASPETAEAGFSRLTQKNPGKKNSTVTLQVLHYYNSHFSCAIL